METPEDFRRWQWDARDRYPEPPPEHLEDDLRAASGEAIEPDEDYPFSGYLR